MIILLFNIQLMSKGGVTAVTCYSIISNIAYLFLAVYNGASATLQPLCSVNLGAGCYQRVRQFFHLGVKTVLVASGLFVLVGELLPRVIVGIFTEPTPQVVSMAVYAIRIYFIAYLPMGINIITSTFHQSLESFREATLISLARGLIFLVPALFLLGEVFGVNDPAAERPAAAQAVCRPIPRGVIICIIKNESAAQKTSMQEQRLLQKEAYNETDFMERQRLARLRGQGLF